MELVVVMLIIAGMIAFLLPTIWRVRGEAARMQCNSNLKQIGLACHSFAQSNPHSELPGGSIDRSAREPGDRLGVLVRLLPHLEQDDLYKKFDLTRPWADQKDTEYAPRCYHCAIDYRPDAAKHSNYVAVAGVGLDAATLPLEDERAGAFGFDRRVRIKDIKDGTSNTVFFLETRSGNGPWASAGNATLRGIDSDDDTPVGKDRAFGVYHAINQWSWRKTPGDCEALQADGSVRTLSAKTSAEVLSALATIAGGEEIPEGW